MKKTVESIATDFMEIHNGLLDIRHRLNDSLIVDMVEEGINHIEYKIEKKYRFRGFETYNVVRFVEIGINPTDNRSEILFNGVFNPMDVESVEDLNTLVWEYRKALCQYQNGEIDESKIKIW